MRKFIIIVLTIIGLAAAVFIPRQNQLAALRAGNAALQKQLQTAPSTAPATLAAPAPGLALNEEKELLRLRSKISFLREEYRAASNNVAVLQRAATKYAKK